MKLAYTLLVTFSIVGCRGDEDSLLGNFDNFPGQIRLSLAHPFDRNNDDYEVVSATSKSADSLIVCEFDDIDRVCGREHEALLIYANEEKKFWRTSISALLEHELRLAFVARSSDRIVDMHSVVYHNMLDPTPGAGGNGGLQGGGGFGNNYSSSNNFSNNSGGNGRQLELTNCMNAGCHANNSNGYGSYTDGQKADSVANGRMPRGKALDRRTKDLLIRYFRN